MSTRINGIMPVMLTPFTEQNEIDWAGLERLVEWYISNGADALFAVAQSSEMQFLSLTEREALGRAVVRQVAGRVPVAVSGHISDDLDAQVEELTVAAKTGADAVILVTNHLDPKKIGGAEAFNATLDALLVRLPPEMPLGLYESRRPIDASLGRRAAPLYRHRSLHCPEGRELRSFDGEAPRGDGRGLAACGGQRQCCDRLGRHAGGLARLLRRTHQLSSRPLQVAVHVRQGPPGATSAARALPGNGRAV